MNHIKQFPHCDSKILHAPSECSVCDMHPDWQELRKFWGIAFTGHSDDLVRYIDWEGNEVVRTLIPCPSEWDRSLKTINMWGGNRPWKDEGVNEYPDQEYDSALDNL